MLFFVIMVDICHFIESLTPLKGVNNHAGCLQANDAAVSVQFCLCAQEGDVPLSNMVIITKQAWCDLASTGG